MKENKEIKKQPFWRNVKVVPYLYILPNMVLFITFMIIPIFMTFYYSLVKWNGLGPIKFVGLSNYVYIFKNEVFLKSIWNTLYYSVVTVPLLMIFSLLFAVLLNMKIPFKGVFRSAIYIPAVVSTVVAGVVFLWLFQSQIGFINYALGQLGIPTIDWTNNPKVAMVMIIIGTLWQKTGYNMVIYLAGLQGISPELHEAATIDGANTWQRFRFVTLPLLRTTHVFVMITCLINSFRSFDLIYTMTKGGPLNATNTLVMYVFDMAFQNNNYGRASAAGVVLFLFMFIFTIMKMRTEKEG